MNINKFSNFKIHRRIFIYCRPIATDKKFQFKRLTCDHISLKHLACEILRPAKKKPVVPIALLCATRLQLHTIEHMHSVTCLMPAEQCSSVLVLITAGRSHFFRLPLQILFQNF